MLLCYFCFKNLIYANKPVTTAMLLTVTVVTIKEDNMSYNDRLMEYEKEKAKLRLQSLTDKEYEQKIRELCERLKI